ALERGGPVRAGVVDEDVQGLLVCRQRVGDGATAGLGAAVARQRDALALLREAGGDLVADLLLSRRNVDLRAGVDEAFGDHEADAARAARNERHLAANVEEVLHRGVIAPRADEVKPYGPGGGLIDEGHGPSATGCWTRNFRLPSFEITPPATPPKWMQYVSPAIARPTAASVPGSGGRTASGPCAPLSDTLSVSTPC